ncbi:hypothetical protein [Spirosoma endbachense]|uniref:Uncharacterized protein n=1 Tax=Spirosoma endbachense TaxID=2666025 RepID=A0A6P1W0L4_9BACT|nr:hypothetical protein [Spirosoma endbachense]QHV97519.1 hypothetical protein GJR95_22040 [Spirosoma endbachense]
MEDRDLVALWKSYDKKLEENLLLNRKNLEAITSIKIQSFLASMKPMKIFTIIVGILWVGVVDVLLINLFTIASPFFLISAGIQVLLTKLAIGIYAYQLILIQLVDINEPIVAVQEKIAQLKSSTIWVTRFLFLQLPVWTTFYWTESMWKNGNIVLYLIQAIITGSFAFLAVWLFRNINYANSEKKWFRLIFSGKEWDPLIKSMDLLSQINDYKNETKNENASL